MCREGQVTGLRVTNVKRDFDDTVYLASLLGGEMAVAKSNGTIQDMNKSFVN